MHWIGVFIFAGPVAWMTIALFHSDNKHCQFSASLLSNLPHNDCTVSASTSVSLNQMEETHHPNTLVHFYDKKQKTQMPLSGKHERIQ